MFKRLKKFYSENVRSRLIAFTLELCHGDNLYVTTVFFIVLFIIIPFAILTEMEWINVMDIQALTAVCVETLLIAIASILRRYFLNKVEDPGKLTTDYKKLVKRYNKAEGLVKFNNTGKAEAPEAEWDVFPVIDAGSILGKEIVIHDDPHKDYVLPTTIVKYYEELFTAHITSKIYNSVNIRVDNWEITDYTVDLWTSRTTYFNSLVTNRAIDFELAKGLSARELLECGPIVRPLNYALLSNHLGFNGFVKTSDDKFIFILRNGDVSIGKRTYGDSIGASLKTKFALNSQFKFDRQGLRKAIVGEIKDELGIIEEELVPLAKQPYLLINAYRDLVEGGKPQLCFYAETTLTAEALDKRFHDIQYDKKHKELQQKNAKGGKTVAENVMRNEVEDELATDGNKCVFVSQKDILQNTRIYPECVIVNIDGGNEALEMPMMPSASACVVMLRSFLMNCQQKGMSKK